MIDLSILQLLVRYFRHAYVRIGGYYVLLYISVRLLETTSFFRIIYQFSLCLQATLSDFWTERSWILLYDYVLSYLDFHQEVMRSYSKNLSVVIAKELSFFLKQLGTHSRTSASSPQTCIASTFYFQSIKFPVCFWIN